MSEAAWRATFDRAIARKTGREQDSVTHEMAEMAVVIMGLRYAMKRIALMASEQGQYAIVDEATNALKLSL